MFQTTLPMFFFSHLCERLPKRTASKEITTKKGFFPPWNFIHFRLAAVEKLKSEKSDVRLPWGFQPDHGENLGGFSTVRPRHSMGMWLGWLHTSWSWTHSGRWVQFFLRYFSRFEIDPFHLLQVNGFGLRRNSFLKPKNCHGICTAFFSGFPLMKSAEVGRCREQRRWLSDIFPVIEMELGFIHYPLFR